MQKRLVLSYEDSLCPRKQQDVIGPGLGEAGRYRMVSEQGEGCARVGDTADSKGSQVILGLSRILSEVHREFLQDREAFDFFAGEECGFRMD